VSSAQDENGVLLGPGQQVVVNDGTLLPSGIGDVGLALSWMKGRLSVHNMPVSELTARLENFDEGRIVVIGDVGTRSISGSFPTTDIPGSLETVADAIGAKVVRTSPWLTVIY